MKKNEKEQKKEQKQDVHLHALCVHGATFSDPNNLNQLKRPNLTYAEGFVIFCEDFTEIGGFE